MGVAESFLEYVQQEPTKKLFESLEDAGIEILWPENNAPQILDRTNFVITGSFDSFSRDELKKLVTDRGGKILSSISKNVNVLLSGDAPGSKFKKSQELGIAIWDENTILQKLGMEREKKTLF